MPATTPGRRPRAAGCPPEQPLAVAGDYAQLGATEAPPGSRGARLADRGVTLAEFEDYLRTVNNRDGRPYEGANINDCVAPARTWMHG